MASTHAPGIPNIRSTVRNITYGYMGWNLQTESSKGEPPSQFVSTPTQTMDPQAFWKCTEETYIYTWWKKKTIRLNSTDENS